MNVTVPANPVERTPLNVRPPLLKVIGLGGGGSNAVNRMIELGLSGVDFIAANTDAQALKSSLAPTRVQLGPHLTRGLGAGGDPKIGEAAAEESYRELQAALSGADMVFLAAGMGGGTGTGSIPVVARIAHSIGAVTIATVSMPFSFEVGRRQKNAVEGLARLRPFTDTLITVPNDRLLQIAPRDLSLELAFRMADDVLRQGIQGITELVTQPGMINVDFAHIRRMMQSGGGSLLSIGCGEGPGKAMQAVERALHHPLLESIPLENVTGIITNFTGGKDLAFFEVAEALTYLQAQTNNQADIIPGVINDERMENRAEVILVITGIGATPVDAAATNSTIVQQPVPEKVVEPQAQQVQPQPPQSQPQQQPSPTPAEPVRMVRLHEPSAVELAGAQTDLDLPAFMRRRVR